MSFREKVKAILEDKKEGEVTMSHPKSQKSKTQGGYGAIKVPHSEVETYEGKGWKVVNKSKPSTPGLIKIRKDESSMDEAKKVKGVRGGLKPLKAKKVTVAQAHKTARKRAEANVDPKVLASRHPDYVPTEEEKSKWAEFYKAKNENSEHPFYQKVKDLSRDKKNKSLLEKKSNSVKTFKILLGTVDKKSKPVSEGKKEDAQRKRREIRDKADATRKKRADQIERARQSELTKKGRRSDQEPDSPGHDATHGDSERKMAPSERRARPRTGTTADELNDLARKIGLPGNWF